MMNIIVALIIAMFFQPLIGVVFLGGVVVAKTLSFAIDELMKEKER